MPQEGTPAPGATTETVEAPKVVHADGTLTLGGDAVEVEVSKGGGYRGTITVPVDRCTVRVMGRALAVFDSGRLVHLCSRCKPTAEVARLVAQLGDRATVEPRTPFATLLALREESAAYRPPGAQGGTEEAAPAAGKQEPEEAPAEIPPDHESLRRVYVSQAAMERDSRRLRAAGWVPHQVSMSQDAPDPQPRSGRLRGLLRAASPSREVTEGVIVWIRRAGEPHAGEPPRNPPEG
ncbi:MAG: hypothetical protein J2P44_11190 [Candidatus Dormibacteraeota bacterium]|nr:hypothetical protein [Candidatus Dormibacteraeota bacterium]